MVGTTITEEDRLVEEEEDGDTMIMMTEVKTRIRPLEEIATVVEEVAVTVAEVTMVIGGSRITGAVVEDMAMMMVGTINMAVTDVVLMKGTMTSMPETDTIIRKRR